MSQLPSHLMVQRISVRLLHDPLWRAKVYANPDKELAPYQLAPSLIQSLIQPDPRAYGVDTHRAERVARAQIDEYSVSVALLSLAKVPPHALTRFVSSEFFHQAIMTRSRLVLAFAEFLLSTIQRARLAKGADVYLLGIAAEMVRLEASIAELRRRHDLQPCQCNPNPFGAPSRGCGEWIQTWRAKVVKVAPGIFEAWQSLHQQLVALAKGEALLAPILDARLKQLKVGRSVKLKGQAVALLIELDGAGEPLLAEASAEMALLLEKAEQKQSQTELISLLQTAELSFEEAQEVLADLLKEGVLQHVG